VTIGWEGQINVWDTETGFKKFNFPSINVSYHVCCLSHDDKIFAAGDYDHYIHFFSMIEQKELHCKKASTMILDMTITHDNKTCFASLRSGDIEVYSLENFEIV
jgi:WD40 repeat protein